MRTHPQKTLPLGLLTVTMVAAMVAFAPTASAGCLDVRIPYRTPNPGIPTLPDHCTIDVITLVVDCPIPIPGTGMGLEDGVGQYNIGTRYGTITVELADATGLPVMFKVRVPGGTSIMCAGSCGFYEEGSYLPLFEVSPVFFTAVETAEYTTFGYALPTSGTIHVTGYFC